MIPFLKREWAQISTKIGLVLTVLSPAVPFLREYAQFDPRFAYASAALGVALIAYREKPDAGAQ